MGVNKVEFDGETLIDLTEDTVTPETLAEGVTAHSASGDPIVGAMKTVDYLLETITVNDTLLWDGNTEGKTVFDMTGDGTYTYYPVSENVLSLDDLQNGVILEMSDATGALQEEIELTDFAKMSNKIIASRSVSSVLFVLEDNAPLYAGTIPKKGIYFMHSAEFGYVSSIKINGYTGFNTEIQVIKEKYLPEIEIGSSLEDITQIDLWYGDKTSVSTNGVDGITWQDKFAFLDENDSVLRTGETYNRIPIMEGENVTFELDEENQVVKINANGGGCVVPSPTTSDAGKFLRVNSAGVAVWETVPNALDHTF